MWSLKHHYRSLNLVMRFLEFTLRIQLKLDIMYSIVFG